MGMRKYYRQIAKARLEALGYGSVNASLGVGMSNSQNRRLHMTKRNRVRFAQITRKYRAEWREVLWGSIAKSGKRALEDPYWQRRKKDLRKSKAKKH